MLRRRRIGVFGLPAIACALACTGWADPILNSNYPNFSLIYVGSGTPLGVPASYTYAGLAFNGGNLLLSGGDASVSGNDQTIYSLGVTRNAAGQITGLANASAFASVPADSPNLSGNVLSGGLMYAPNGALLYTTWSQSFIGQYSVSHNSSLTAVNGLTLGALGYLPNGQVVTTDTSTGAWYAVTLSPDQSGQTYTIQVGNTPLFTTGGNPESFATIGSGSSAQVLVGDRSDLLLYSTINGIPSGTPTQIVTANGASIGYGLVQDPYHSQSYLFTTDNNQIWELTVPTPEPSAGILALGGLLLLLAVRRKQNR